MLHLPVTHIFVLVDIENLMIVLVFLLLVKYAQHLCQAVVHPSVQKRYLHNDTVVGKALYEWVGHSFCHLIAVIVIRFVAYIKHWLLDVAHAVTEQIHCYHGDAVAVGATVLVYVVRIGILGAEILAETQSLRFQPCLLQFYEHKFQAAVILTHLCPEVNAEHRDFIVSAIGVLMLAHIHLHHLFLK